MLSFIAKLFRKDEARLEHPEHAYHVEDAGEEIRCQFKDHPRQSVRWTDLVEIRIFTTDEGPLLPDFYWRFITPTGEVVFPEMALGYKAVIDRAMKLPGYDFEQSIAAVRSTENAEFIVWRLS